MTRTFHEREHRWRKEVICELTEDGKPFRVQVVITSVDDDAEAGGAKFLGDLCQWIKDWSGPE